LSIVKFGWSSLATVADETDAEVLQVVSRQLRQYRSINGVVAKRLLVLLQPETAEPCPDVHARLPDAVTATRGLSYPESVRENTQRGSRPMLTRRMMQR
jgi:hypothetical protein